MSTPPEDPRGDDLPRSDDRTRNIRLPSLPDRPPSAVRSEWQSYVPPPATDTPPAAAGQPEPGNEAPSVPSPGRPAPPRPYVFPDELTDEMSSPPKVRQRTLAFDAPQAAPASASGPVAPAVPVVSSAPSAAPSPFVPPAQSAPSYAPPSYVPAGHGRARTPERNRRWPWVVLTVLPILVIIGAGLMLIFLLRGG